MRVSQQKCVVSHQTTVFERYEGSGVLATQELTLRCVAPPPTPSRLARRLAGMPSQLALRGPGPRHTRRRRASCPGVPSTPSSHMTPRPRRSSRSRPAASCCVSRRLSTIIVKLEYPAQKTAPHPIQRRYLAEQIVQLRRADEEERYASSQRQGRIDPNPHQIDAVIFALKRR